MHPIPNPRNPHLRSVAKTVALSFLWVPAFAGMTARFAMVSSVGEDSEEGEAQCIRIGESPLGGRDIGSGHSRRM